MSRSVVKQSLIPGQALIYERANGVTYARYRDPPHNMIERWVVGGEPKAVAEAMGVIDYDEWKDIMMAAETNYTLRKLIQKLRNTYYMIGSKE
jgi:hypothetical protein|tara:strand:- start:403 stop:681 length:279 start_codon:yes stop_codon:yes gene_type:complete